MSEVRFYFTIDAGATRSAANWQLVLQQAAGKPMIGAIRQAGANRNTPQNGLVLARFSINPVRRYVLGKDEEDASDVDALQTVLNQQCALRGINTGTARGNLQALLQAEVREAATDVGLGSIASVIFVTIVGFGLRYDAVAEVTTWFAANSTVWQ